MPERNVINQRKRLLFVCFGNANRSQLAEAFARVRGGDRVEAYSAGVKPAALLDERAIAAMSARGYDLRAHWPKDLSEVPQIECDAVVTMGCDESCPAIPARHHFSWDLPQASDPEEYAALCQTIEARVNGLLTELFAEPAEKESK